MSDYIPVRADAAAEKILSDAGIYTVPYATGSRTWGVVPSVHRDAWDRAVAALHAAGYEYCAASRSFDDPWLVEERRKLSERAAARMATT